MSISREGPNALCLYFSQYGDISLYFITIWDGTPCSTIVALGKAPKPETAFCRNPNHQWACLILSHDRKKETVLSEVSHHWSSQFFPLFSSDKTPCLVSSTITFILIGISFTFSSILHQLWALDDLLDLRHYSTQRFWP